MHNGTQRVPHEPVVAEWLFFPHPVYRRGLLLRFSKKTAVTLHLPTALTASIGQAAGELPQEGVDKMFLRAEAGQESEVDVERESRLTPSLNGNAADDAKAPPRGATDGLELDRRREDGVHGRRL